VVEPVSRLLVTMTRFARGDLDARTGPPRERGELGELCNAFDRMADRIRAQHNPLLRHLRDMYPRVVRVLLTGYPQIDTVVEAVNQGAFFRFAVKPWDDQQLLGHIRAAFRHHHQLMEERP